jgi:TonB family protein
MLLEPQSEMKSFVTLLCCMALSCGILAQIEEDQEPLTVVESMPVWGTCPDSAGEGFMHPSRECTEQAIADFVVAKLKYPKKARRKGIEGKVVVKFVVEKNGEVGDVLVVHSVSPLLDQEAVRVVQAMPAFRPGTQSGKPVRVMFHLPFNFALN